MMILDFNIADYIILGVIVFSLLISLARGFVREALSLATWILAALFAFRFSSPVGDMLSGIIHNPSIRSVVVFASLFILILIIGGIASFFISKLVSGSILRGLDRILGVFFGIARGLLVIGLFVCLMGQTAFVKADWWKNSQLIPQFGPVCMLINDLFPDQMAQFAEKAKPKPIKNKRAK